MVPGASPVWQRAQDDSIIGSIFFSKLIVSVCWLSSGTSLGVFSGVPSVLTSEDEVASAFTDSGVEESSSVPQAKIRTGRNSKLSKLSFPRNSI